MEKLFLSCQIQHKELKCHVIMLVPGTLKYILNLVLPYLNWD